MNTDLVSYYKDRAEEYEKVYAKPERQKELQNATVILQRIFSGKQVLEIACGTGYWTERIASHATSVYATDINETVLNVAKRKKYSNGRVSFGLANMYHFPACNQYESLFAGFTWSHIPLQDLHTFLRSVNNLVSPGGTVVFMDNNFAEGSNRCITHTDENQNTFQTRTLEDGTPHLILKNFPSEKFLRHTLRDIASEIKYIDLTYYWILSYTIPVEGSAVG